MSARRCARCGTSVGPDEYLCWDCRQSFRPDAGNDGFNGRGGSARWQPPPSRIGRSAARGSPTAWSCRAASSITARSLTDRGRDRPGHGARPLGELGRRPFIASGVTVWTADSATDRRDDGDRRRDQSGNARRPGAVRGALHDGRRRRRIPTQSVTTTIPAHGTGSVSIDLPIGAQSSHVSVDCK